MTDHDARKALAELIRTRLLGVAPQDQDLELDDDDWRLILASLPAPTPAAGEAVADILEDCFEPKAYGIPRANVQAACRRIMSLYAAPQQFAESANSSQPPAPGGDAVVEADREIGLSVYRDYLNGKLEDEGQYEGEMCAIHAAARVRAALANHSPDAGGVGEAWVCDGIPDEVIEAGISAWDAAKHDMENYVSGVTTDWDEGMIVAAIYKAMSASIRPGLRAGEE